eukprot:Skav227215  [mRNA]  locus=scaffold2048:403266:406284:- [translate_table: standard]
MAPEPQVPVTPTRPVPDMPLVCKPVTSRAPKFCGKDMAFKCQECNQSFDTEHALNLHVKYIHRSKED